MKLCKLLLVGCFVFIGISNCFSQEKYWVLFTDKDGVTFNPHDYFHIKAIERRETNNIPLNHYSDRPVRADYLATIKNNCDTVLQVTRWFNGAAVRATVEQIQTIQQKEFVKEIIPIESTVQLAATTSQQTTYLTSDQQYVLKNQTKRMGAEHFRQASINGEGIRVAILDAGFPGVNTNPAFEHIRKRGGIVETWDFVKNKPNVYKYSGHGTSVLSCVGGKYNDQIIGMATGAEFLLARTEIAGREPFSEEENWLAALEWADKNGAHIINSSLAYTFHRYFRYDMDGKKTFISRAANTAASKGILVVNAAGNDGDNKWKVMGAPGDADSVLTIGGIDPYSDYHIDFSSFGPTSDFRMKPNVCAFGEVTAANEGGMHSTQGTSFASPLVAGFAACALQMNPKLTTMELFREIEKSGDLYPYFDYAHGFGVPQAAYFTTAGIKKKPEFHLEKDEFIISVIVENIAEPEIDISDTTNTFQNMMNALADAMNKSTEYLYYHIENEKGYLDKYVVMEVTEKTPVKFFTEDYKKGSILRIHYKGQTETHTF